MAEIIKFDAGIPEILALKFDAGKNCVGRFGPQVQFTTTDERIFWLDPDPANDVERELQKLGIQPGTEFRLTKVKTSHGGFRYAVERQPEMPRRDTGGHNVPDRHGNVYRDTPQQQPARQDAPPPPANPITPTSARLLAAYMLAVDTLLETQVYATRKGLMLTIATEDVRCLAATLLIESKGGR